MNKKTNKSMSFQERAKLAMEVLAKQKPVSIEIARAQVRRLKEQSSSKTKKGEARIIKKLTKDQIKEVQQFAEQLKQKYPTYRNGQIFFNALIELHPELATSIIATDIDPFHDDNNIEKCIAEISE